MPRPARLNTLHHPQLTRSFVGWQMGGMGTNGMQGGGMNGMQGGMGMGMPPQQQARAPLPPRIASSRRPPPFTHCTTRS